MNSNNIDTDTVDVLIVDDRIDGLVTLEAVLNFSNVNLVKAQSGREALDLLQLYDFGLILLDVQMPEMDGFETAALIRKNENYKKTPIIFVTAINKDDRYIYQGYEVGAVDYIFKPFEPQILRSKVSIFVDLFVKSRQLQKQAEIIRESERRERYLRLTELEVESLKRYRNLADAIPHIIWRARADGTLDYFNKGWSEYTGISEEESLLNGWQVAIHEVDIADFLKTWMDSMVVGKAFEVECRIKNKNGDFRWHWVKAVAEYNRSGGLVVAWLGTCTDINDRKRTEIELKKAEQDAKAANLSKTSFLANMSHEIRTPMNAILGFTEMMQDPEQTFDERIKCISVVHRSGKQLLKIIDEILDISKIEAGYLEVENVEVNLGNLLADLQSLLLPQAEEKGLLLEFSMKSKLPLMVYSDPSRLRQILLNIVGNAIKFTQKGYVKIDIDWLIKSKLTGTMQFRVIDSGVGITALQIEKLFQPFMQADSSTTRHFGGTGLGLALSRQLARALGGDIIVEKSEPGYGSQFLVELNLSIKEGTQFSGTFKSDVPVSFNNFSAHEDKILQSIKILLAEDVVDNQELTKYFLNLAGAHVDTAENGEQAVAKVLNGNYDVVLMDIQMPLLDGYEATKKLRTMGYQGPIIALTAHALKEEQQKSIEVGCSAHFTKPIEFKILVDQIVEVIKLQKLAKEKLLNTGEASI